MEICYGHNGLISFLDLLFTQFPTKEKVKNRFNYYFSLKKQLEQIEENVELEIEKPGGGTVKSRFDWRSVLDNKSEAAVKDKKLASSLLVPNLAPTKSIIFKAKDGEACMLDCVR